MSTLTLPPIELLATSAAELADAAREAGDTANMHAINKAVAQLHAGCTPIVTYGGFLIESRTRGGVVHRVDSVRGCSCEAGQRGRACWHQAMLEVIGYAQQFTRPAVPNVRDRALALVNELYAA